MLAPSPGVNVMGTATRVSGGPDVLPISMRMLGRLSGAWAGSRGATTSTLTATVQAVERIFMLDLRLSGGCQAKPSILLPFSAGAHKGQTARAIYAKWGFYDFFVEMRRKV
jgi:hypothetical protein